MDYAEQVRIDDVDIDISGESSVLDEVMDDLVDEISLGLCFEIHRTCKLGTYNLDDTDPNGQKMYELINERGLDVFGQLPMKKQIDCVCPNCKRSIAASRFAPHLEKCMGMGRNSSRLASRRIANAQKKEGSDNESENGDNNDNDWNYVADKRAKKLKRDRNNHSNSPRRGKSKNKNGDVSNADSGNYLAPYESMSLEERRGLLNHTCGVISEHTKKMCTRSGRCPQHTDNQRRAVRITLLGNQNFGMADGGPGDTDIVDIDTFDDNDGTLLRETLQWEAASNPSPADSNSTTGSLSRKRKATKSKKKGSKSRHQTERSDTPNSGTMFEVM